MSDTAPLLVDLYIPVRDRPFAVDPLVWAEFQTMKAHNVTLADKATLYAQRLIELGEPLPARAEGSR